MCRSILIFPLCVVYVFQCGNVVRFLPVHALGLEAAFKKGDLEGFWSDVFIRRLPDVIVGGSGCHPALQHPQPHFY